MAHSGLPRANTVFGQRENSRRRHLKRVQAHPRGARTLARKEKAGDLGLESEVLVPEHHLFPFPCKRLCPTRLCLHRLFSSACADYSQVDGPCSQYRPVNFGAKSTHLSMILRPGKRSYPPRFSDFGFGVEGLGFGV